MIVCPATNPSVSQLPPSVRVMVPDRLTVTVSGTPTDPSAVIVSPAASVITEALMPVIVNSDVFVESSADPVTAICWPMAKVVVQSPPSVRVMVPGVAPTLAVKYTGAVTALLLKYDAAETAPLVK